MPSFGRYKSDEVRQILLQDSCSDDESMSDVEPSDVSSGDETGVEITQLRKQQISENAGNQSQSVSECSSDSESDADSRQKYYYCSCCRKRSWQ